MDQLSQKIKIFLDASVLISASISATGASRELFNLANNNLIELTTNEDAAIEARRNLANKVPEGVVVLQLLLSTPIISVADSPTLENLGNALAYTVRKDAPIVAGAIETESTYLATFDRKHLINPPEVSQNSGLIIATSGDILKAIRIALNL